MRRLAIALAFVLAGCAGAGIDLTGATPAQRLYAAEGTYRTVLELAVAYKEACFARPRRLQATCRPIVRRIRTMDAEVARVRATAGGDTAALTAAIAVLRRHVVAEAMREGLR